MLMLSRGEVAEMVSDHLADCRSLVGVFLGMWCHSSEQVTVRGLVGRGEVLDARF